MSNTTAPMVIVGNALAIKPGEARDIPTLMVAILNDEAFCAQLRAVATPGCFGEVVRDLALAMVEAKQ